jgi:hypothetical protein
VGTNITNLQSKIGSFFDGLWENLSSSFGSFLDAISGLPDKIFEGIKGIFIPTEEDITKVTDKLESSFESLLITYDLKALFSSTKAIGDVDVTIMGSTATVIDTSSLTTALNDLRPYIRGFLVLLLVFFNINQFMVLIGLNPISIIGKSNDQIGIGVDSTQGRIGTK